MAIAPVAPDASCEKLPPLNVTVGVDAYPEPLSVTVTLTTPSAWSTWILRSLSMNLTISSVPIPLVRFVLAISAWTPS